MDQFPPPNLYFRHPKPHPLLCHHPSRCLLPTAVLAVSGIVYMHDDIKKLCFGQWAWKTVHFLAVYSQQISYIPYLTETNKVRLSRQELL